jgi:DNA-binding beta-propeller fold protein YncE
MVVASSNARGIYCSAFLTLFSRDREQKAMIPLVFDQKEYSYLGEVKADPSRGFLYLTERLQDSLLVFRIEGEDLRFIRAIPVGGEASEKGRGGADPFGLDINPWDGTVAVAATGSGDVIFYSAGAESELGRVALGSVYPIRVRFNPGGDHAWVTADSGNYLYLLSLSPPALQTYFSGVSGSPGTTPVMEARALWVGEEGVYVTAGSPQALLYFNPATGLAGAIALGEGVYPFDLKGLGSRFYLSSLKRNEIWVLDRERGETIKIISTLKTEGKVERGKGPSEIMIGPEPGRALVTGYESGDIIVLDLENLTVESYWTPGE